MNHFSHFPISNLHVKRLVIPDCRHDRTHKLQKNYQTLVWLYRSSFRLRLVNKPFQHIRVLAWMNRQHPAVQIRHRLFSHRLIVILLVNVLKYLFWCQRQSVKVIPLHPQSWRMVVLVVCDIHLVGSEVFFLRLDFSVSGDFNEAVIILFFGLIDGLFGEFLNAVEGSGLGHEILFAGIGEMFVEFVEWFLPFPSKVLKLVACLDELFWCEYSSVFEVLFRGSEFGVDEVFYGADHLMCIDSFWDLIRWELIIRVDLIKFSKD